LTPTLPPALAGERFEFDSPAGRLSAYASRPAADSPMGTPLLLIHSVNAAASAAEIAPVYEYFRSRRPVYAIDLPGFGFSERGARAYTPRLMTDAVQAIAARVAERHGGGPIDALALSLGCEFLARAAAEAPARYRSLALVSPTGFNGPRRRRGAPGSTLHMPWLSAALTGPGWGGALFRQLTRPGVVRFFLRKTFGSRVIDEGLWQTSVTTARQPGAEHAPLAFLSGTLFSRDINDVYERLTQPVWMSHGTRGDFVDYQGKTTVEARPNWRITVMDTGALPYFDQPQAFCTAYEAFLRSVPG
jgi:pimeloyl-ACP methyl ester carboxylesterase